MKPLVRRLEALEIKTPPASSGVVELEKLTIQELDRLEALVKALDAGMDMASMTDADLRFIASLQFHAGD